jgi:flagellin
MVGGNDAFDGASNLGIAGLGGGSMTTDSTHNVLTFKIDGGAAQSITLSSQASATAASFASDINSKLAAAGITGMTATTNGGGKLVLESTVTGSGHSIQVVSGGTNDASGSLSLGTNLATGTDANVGFGFKGSSFTGNTQGAAPSTSPNVISGGAYQTDAMSFSALANGADNQTINITASDASGVSHTTNVVLKNNALAQPDSTTGASIDSAVNAINNALQQSGNAALQGVVAVKYNDNGTEKIKFASDTNKFSVTVGTTADHSGVGSQGMTATAAMSGTGSTADISTVEGAQAAVNALATAVQNLGVAQAAVGKGQNNLNYAINLATSQTTNEAASESQLRDANLAQEAANLSRAQILVQAGTAALAQANSAPQQLLSLLRG